MHLLPFCFHSAQWKLSFICLSVNMTIKNNNNYLKLCRKRSGIRWAPGSYCGLVCSLQTWTPHISRWRRCSANVEKSLDTDPPSSAPDSDLMGGKSFIHLFNVYNKCSACWWLTPHQLNDSNRLTHCNVK